MCETDRQHVSTNAEPDICVLCLCVGGNLGASLEVHQNPAWQWLETRMTQERSPHGTACHHATAPNCLKARALVGSALGCWVKEGLGLVVHVPVGCVAKINTVTVTVTGQSA